jgi:type II secretory pathway pseudopilin PulG
MKIVLYFLVIAAAGWAGWIAQPGLYKWMQGRLDSRKEAQDRKIAESVNRNKADSRLDANGTGTSPSDIFNKVTGPRTPTPPGPGTVANTTPTPVSKSPTDTPPPPQADEFETRYPLPTFRSIEEITKEWSQIPSRAFPRKLKTKVELTFEGAAGKTVLPSGSDAWAGGMVAGMLIVMKTKDDGDRIQVPLANTDLKETMTMLYEKYKDFHKNRVLKQREEARARKGRANGATEQQMAMAGPKPEIAAGGVVTVALNDIKSGKYVELKESSITAWGNLAYDEIEGASYWTVPVQCTVENPLFGPQPTEVMALIKENKVVKWIYTGSHEPVQ